jgi:hexosaminidase
MNEIIKKQGKQTICWEGFHGDGGGGAKIPKDILVMPFESTYNPANNLVKLGYTVINTAWKPLYVVNEKHWPAQYIYENWNLRLWEHHINTRCHIQLTPDDPVLGAQMCAWEQPADRELPSLRVRLHAMGERIWNPDAGKTYAGFAARAAKTDKLLDRVLGFVDVQAEGLSGKQYRGFEYFWDPIAVRLSAVPVGTIHYTIDGKDPTLQSPKYAGPIRLGKDDARLEKLFFNGRTKRFEDSGDVVRVKARTFDAAGRPVGDVVTVRQYWRKNPAEQQTDQSEK